ncbi:hypothetical protein H072_655 [Dactylellina haptotyla CBS 200.50]|uniref:Uncharacterized protein n=1 Tax=Dactylellina haptotyla (strain CBS 200.50) TaxID=1284197 RepID=S8C126_DACHA|nr:hypothetical protein H072_655 [Dactylellina haptotyla CBS 200.50]
MKLLTTVILAALAVLEIPTVSATPGSCGVSSVTSCTKAIKSTKTRTLSLTSWCQSVLGCVKSTTTITGDPVTTTTTLSVTETYSFEVLASETFTTTTFTYTETQYTEAARVTFRPTWTVEKFVVVTVTPRAVRRNGVYPKDLLKRATKTTSICASAVQKQACLLRA